MTDLEWLKQDGMKLLEAAKARGIKGIVGIDVCADDGYVTVSVPVENGRYSAYRFDNSPDFRVMFTEGKND